MGTAAGFFGITYQGAVNGLASVTLSVFNMVRRASKNERRERGHGHCHASLSHLQMFLARVVLGRTTPMTARG